MTDEKQPPLSFTEMLAKVTTSMTNSDNIDEVNEHIQRIFQEGDHLAINDLMLISGSVLLQLSEHISEKMVEQYETDIVPAPFEIAQQFIRALAHVACAQQSLPKDSQDIED